MIFVNVITMLISCRHIQYVHSLTIVNVSNKRKLKIISYKGSFLFIIPGSMSNLLSTKIIVVSILVPASV